MATTPAGQKKKGNKANFETFPPPPLDMPLISEVLLNCSMKNDYQTVCGAYDAKDHPLAMYINSENLFKKRDSFEKAPFDYLCILGNHTFMKALIDRNEKLGPENLDFTRKNANGYTCLHFACVWGNLDLCKLIVLQTGPTGSALLKAETVSKETPKQIATRYGHANIIDFLTFAEIRISLIEKINDWKDIAANPERNLGKLNKDDKKKIDKIYADFSDWLEKCKIEPVLGAIMEKRKEIEEALRPFNEKLTAI